MLQTVLIMPQRKLIYTLMAFCFSAVLLFIYHEAFYLGKEADIAFANVAHAPRTQPPHIPAYNVPTLFATGATRDRIVPTLASGNFAATSSPASTSLRAYLSSCNATLQREECSAVAVISGSKSCVLGERTYVAGLGHQMSEVLMWLRHAHLENSSHIFELFGPIVAKEHGDSYEWVNSFFGLVHAVHSMHGIIVNDVNTNLPTSQCDDVKRPEFKRCGAAISADSDVDCFVSSRMTKLFASYAPCLRQSALCFGDWVMQSRALPFDSAVVNVAWHIRVGDKTLYEASSSYYREDLTCTTHAMLHTSHAITGRYSVT